MTTFSGAAALATEGLLIAFSVASTINSLVTPPAPILPDFTWAPNSPLTLLVGSSVPLSALKTPTETLITFTAAPFIPPDRQIVRYDWDFGDGTTGVGATVAHTFKLENFNASVRLCITDEREERICVGHRIYLYDPTPTTPIVPFRAIMRTHQ